MNMVVPSAGKPRIVLAKSEEQRLSALATAAELTGRSESVARFLLAEMERAEIVDDGDVPSDVVRMHSWVEFEIDDRNARRVQLVFPGEADIGSSRVSVLTPIGAALIGLSPSQQMPLHGYDDREHTLRILSVVQEPLPAGPAGAAAVRRKSLAEDEVRERARR